MNTLLKLVAKKSLDAQPFWQKCYMWRQIALCLPFFRVDMPKCHTCHHVCNFHYLNRPCLSAEHFHLDVVLFSTFWLPTAFVFTLPTWTKQSQTMPHLKSNCSFVAQLNNWRHYLTGNNSISASNCKGFTLLVCKCRACCIQYIKSNVTFELVFNSAVHMLNWAFKMEMAIDSTAAHN